MGDVAMTAPVMSMICRQNPDVEFHFLSTSMYEPFFEPFPNFRFIGTDIKKNNSVSAIWQLFRQLRKNDKYDFVIDLHDVLRTQILRTFFSLTFTKSFIIYKGREEKKALTRKGNKIVRQLTVHTYRYAEVFHKAGLKVDEITGVQPPRDLPKIDFLPEKKGTKWIGISPFAQHRGKNYSKEKMQIVVEMLCAEPNTKVLIFGGGEDEKEVADKWDAAYQNCYSMIGRVPFFVELAVISHLDVMVSMDSAAMHMASIFGVRVVSIWCATHPYAGFLGYGQSEDDVIQRPLKCRPCSVYGNKKCRFGNYRCANISPEVIVERVLTEKH